MHVPTSTWGQPSAGIQTKVQPHMSESKGSQPLQLAPGKVQAETKSASYMSAY